MSKSGAFLQKQLMSQYKDSRQGQAAAILGGGPSLPGDLARLPDDCILIAVNYHALYLVQADYMVYNDDPESDPRLLDWVQRTEAVRVSPHASADIRFDVDVWTGFYSSNTAAWFALWMGCSPVILCGHDLYQGERVYFHEYSHDAPCFHYPLDHHLRPWVEDGRARLPHVERLRAMSGPLVGVFGAYQEAA